MSEEKTIYCPYCLSDDLRPKGTRKSESKNPEKRGTEKKKWKCRRCTRETVNPLDDDHPRLNAGKQKFRTTLTVPRKERYVITCAQNATDVHPVLETLKSYCHNNDAELLVIPIRYHNPTSHWGADAQASEWWVPEVGPYLFGARKKLHKHIELLGDVSTQLTAERPTSGFETISGAHSAIIGHPKMELQYRATPQQKLPKAIMTTGTCTVRSYIDGKAGKKGEFHHSFGGIVVERDGDRFHFRQLNALEDGSFIDVDKTGVKEYFPDGSTKHYSSIPLLVCGDLHQRFMCPKSVAATVSNSDSMFNVLNPEAVAWHDVMDGYACNPHDRENPFMAHARQRYQFDDIRTEIEDCARFFDMHCKGRRNYIVASNHEDFLSRWMQWVDWRKDLKNAEFYLETALKMVRAGKITDQGYRGIHPFPSWMQRLVREADITYLGVDESLVIQGIEAGFHGHRGPDGARGTLNNYGRIGVKTIIGHSHSPGIRNGAMQVGTLSQLSLDYTSGPSSWMNTNGAVYPNGKRALLNIIDGVWRLA